VTHLPHPLAKRPIRAVSLFRKRFAADIDEVILRYPFSFAVLFVAFALTGTVFLFLRPEYHDPFPGTTVDLSGYPPAAHGWTWQNGTPGFVVKTGREDWNVSRVRPGELPRGARLLNALRELDGVSLLVARGRCIGAALPSRVAWFCPPQLDSDLAFVVVYPMRPYAGTHVYSLNLLGVARADVKRIVVVNPAKLQRVHRDNSVTTRYAARRQTLTVRGNWGTWEESVADEYAGAPPARPWRVRLDFYGAHHRLLASQQLAFASAGTRLVVVH
jgi:hypothetical protein